jgi:6-pyruvoyltetrahydropterin/6-carboxytetrahydropterin synthase
MFSRTRQISEPKWNQKLYLMPTNPTAENMANYLLRSICPMVLADTGVVVSKVVVRETENCWAEATL